VCRVLCHVLCAVCHVSCRVSCAVSCAVCRVSCVGCVPCECNGHADESVGSCDNVTGVCYCTHNTHGRHCQLCDDGYYGDPRSDTLNYNINHSKHNNLQFVQHTLPLPLQFISDCISERIIEVFAKVILKLKLGCIYGSRCGF